MSKKSAEAQIPSKIIVERGDSSNKTLDSVELEAPPPPSISKSPSISTDTPRSVVPDQAKMHSEGTSDPQLGTIEPAAELKEEVSDAITHPEARISRTHVIHSLFSSLTPILALLTAFTLSAMTITIGSVSFSQNLIYQSPFFPTNSTNAIFVLQLLATLSSLALQEAFLLSCEVFRWSLVTAPEGTGLLTSIVLSRSCSFWGLAFSPVRPIFSRCRAFAMLKILILYVAILLGNFVWLLNISTRPAYRALAQNMTIPLYDPIFSLDPQGYPYPFSRLEVWNFVYDTTRIVEIDPVICSPEDDLHCVAYVAPVNTIYKPDVDYQGGPTSKYDGFQWSIVPNNPSFFIQFQSGTSGAATLDDPDDPWAYCVNHTTPTRASIRLCMGGVSRSSTVDSSVITAGLRYCVDISNCPDIADPNYFANIFILNMTIQAALSETIISWDESIASVQQVQNPQSFAVNVSEFFTAFAAPLMPDIPISVSQIEIYAPNRSLDLDYDSQNIANTSIAADQFVEAAMFSFGAGFGNPAVELRDFLVYALVRNSWGNNNTEQYAWIPADTTYDLALSPISLPAFIAVVGICILVSSAMLIRYKWLNGWLATFPDIQSWRKVNEEDDLNTVLTIGTNTGKLENVKVRISSTGSAKIVWEDPAPRLPGHESMV
jgi:hypothetical protein